MVRLKTFRSEQEALAWMNSNSIGLGNIVGPLVNSSGQSNVVYEEAAVDEKLFTGRKSPGGVSYAHCTAAGDFELMAKRTAVAAEVVVAIAAQLVTGVLASGYVIPGTVSLTDSGGTGTPLKDDGAGKIVEVGTNTSRGTINYATKAVSFTYPANRLGSGNLLADYQYSDYPDTADPPPCCRITNVSVSLAAGGDVTFTVYNDAAKKAPVFSSKVTVVAAEGTLQAGGNYFVSPIMETVDPTKRNRRWVHVDKACDFWMYWEFCS